MQIQTKGCTRCGSATGGGSCPTCLDEREGERLPAGTASKIESAYGATLSDDVRVHPSGCASEFAASKGLRAFALGNDIGFAAGEYRPGTFRGDALIAHEAAHVLQQGLVGGGSPDPGHEADADRAAASVVGRSLGLQTASPGPRRPAALGLHGCSGSSGEPGQGLAPALAAGKESRSYTLDQYIKMWEKHQGRKMSSTERETLAKGCVGVSRLNLGGSAPTNQCFATFAQAQAKQDELAKSGGVRPYIFSKRFWSMGKAFPADPNGRIDMSNDSGDSPAGAVNFDYGWYDEKTNSWWHANHCDPVTGSDKCRDAYKDVDPASPNYRMDVRQSTLAHYSDPNYFGADKQVFCVAFSTLK